MKSQRGGFFLGVIVGMLIGLAIALGVAWALLGGIVVYGLLKAIFGIRLSAEEEFEGADLSIHKIGSSPDREANW